MYRRRAFSIFYRVPFFFFLFFGYSLYFYSLTTIRCSFWTGAIVHRSDAFSIFRIYLFFFFIYIIANSSQSIYVTEFYFLTVVRKGNSKNMVNIVPSVYLLLPGLQKIGKFLALRWTISLNYTSIYFCVYVVSGYENFFLYPNKTGCPAYFIYIFITWSNKRRRIIRVKYICNYISYYKL